MPETEEYTQPSLTWWWQWERQGGVQPSAGSWFNVVFTADLGKMMTLSERSLSLRRMTACGPDGARSLQFDVPQVAGMISWRSTVERPTSSSFANLSRRSGWGQYFRNSRHNQSKPFQVPASAARITQPSSVRHRIRSCYSRIRFPLALTVGPGPD